MEYEYKIVDVMDGTLSSVLAGGRGVYVPLVEACINALVADGWRLLSGPVPWGIASMLITLERPVPIEAREARAAQSLDDVIVAEDAAVQIMMEMEDSASAESKATMLRRTAQGGVIGTVLGGLFVAGERSDG